MMLKRQPLWIPVLKHNPGFAEAFHKFKKASPVTNLLFNSARISEKEICVALDTDTRNPNKQVAVLMAFPMLVHRDLCDDAGSDGGKGLVCGVEAALSDAMNTIHVMERLLPENTPNVSVSIHAESLKPINKGDRILAVSAIDKFGKGIVYLKTDFYLEPESLSKEILMREQGDVGSAGGASSQLFFFFVCILGFCCPLWQSVAELEPQLMEQAEESVKRLNRFAGAFRECVELPLRNFRIAGEKLDGGAVLSPDAATALSFPSGARPYLFHHLAAMPLTVPLAVCEEAGGEPHMSAGPILALTDMLTSFHIWVVNLPQPAQHVSVSLQCNSCGPLVAGRSYIAISRIDRLGNRIVYASMEFIEPTWPPRAPPPSSLDTLPKLRAALRECVVVVNAKHTKSIIPSGGLKRTTEPSGNDGVGSGEAGSPTGFFTPKEIEKN